MSLIDEGYIKARGLREQYDIELYRDLIYFATDTHEIILNDEVYGTTQEALDALELKIKKEASTTYAEKEYEQRVEALEKLFNTAVHPEPGQILYTTIDDKKIELKDYVYDSKFMGKGYSNITTNVVSNEYYPSKGYGIITLNTDVVSKYLLWDYPTLESVIVSGSFKGLDQCAIANNANLKEIYLEDGILILGFCSLGWNSILREIALPDSITGWEIEGTDGSGHTFYYCTSLLSCKLPKNITTIPNSCFKGCESLINVYLPNGIVSLEMHAFDSCKSLVSIELPDSLKTIRQQAFMWCHNLTHIDLKNVTMLGNGNLNDLDESVFQYCISLKELRIPNGVTHLSNTFGNCTNCDLVVFPASLVNTKLWWLCHPRKIDSSATFINSNFPSPARLEELILRHTSVVTGLTDYLGKSRFEGTGLLAYTANQPLSKLRIIVPANLLENYKTTYPTFAKYFHPLKGEDNVYAYQDNTYTKLEVDSKLSGIDIPNIDVSLFINNAKYNSETENIEFYHEDNLIASVSRNDILSDALKDGMLDNVELIGNDLVFTFNTDADKTAIRIDLTTFLNPEEFVKIEDFNLFKEEFEEALYEDPTNGYEFVDMGEAGIWAKYPIGVSEWNNESLNNIKYFEWGGIEGYTASQVGVDKLFSNNFTDYRFSGENATSSSNPQLTKYCSNASYGKDKTFTDSLTTLLPEDDVCTINMNGNWRIPTVEEFKKLNSLCNNELVTNYNGVDGLNGRLFKLKTDESKQLFFPAAGNCEIGSTKHVGSNGYFWSSSLCDPSPRSGFYLYFSSSLVNAELSNFRCYGYPVVGLLDYSKKPEKYLPKKEAEETYYTKQEVDDKLSNIDISDVDLSEIESKLDGVTKAADDSEVVKRIWVNGGVSISMSKIMNPGSIMMESPTYLNIKKGNIGPDEALVLDVNIDKIATKEDLEEIDDKIANIPPTGFTVKEQVKLLENEQSVTETTSITANWGIYGGIFDNIPSEEDEIVEAGEYTFNVGVDCTPLGELSFTAGHSNVAKGDVSHAEGLNNVTNNTAEVAFGTFNDSHDDTIFTIGNGEGIGSRHNAFEIKKDGTYYIPDIYAISDDDNSYDYYNLPMINLQEKLKQLEESSGNIDLSNIEAVKLKTPVTIWGQEFDGSKNITGPISVDTAIFDQISAMDGVGVTINDELYVNGVINASDDISLSNKNILGLNTITFSNNVSLSATDVLNIKSTLEEVIKGIEFYDDVAESGEFLQPIGSNKSILIRGKSGINLTFDDTQMGENGLIIFPDTTILATKEDLNNIEAVRLKNSINLWGQDFTGDENISDEIQLNVIKSTNENTVLFSFNESNGELEIGTRVQGTNFGNTSTNIASIGTASIDNLSIKKGTFDDITVTDSTFDKITVEDITANKITSELAIFNNISVNSLANFADCIDLNDTDLQLVNTILFSDTELTTLTGGDIINFRSKLNNVVEKSEFDFLIPNLVKLEDGKILEEYLPINTYLNNTFASPSVTISGSTTDMIEKSNNLLTAATSSYNIRLDSSDWNEGKLKYLYLNGFTRVNGTNSIKFDFSTTNNESIYITGNPSEIDINKAYKMSIMKGKLTFYVTIEIFDII